MREAVKNLLYELPKTSHGKALKEYLDEQIKEVNDVTGVVTLEDVKGKQIAVKILKKIFAFLGDKSVDVKPKNQYN